jgi:hypothetical protein
MFIDVLNKNMEMCTFAFSAVIYIVIFHNITIPNTVPQNRIVPNALNLIIQIVVFCLKLDRCAYEVLYKVIVCEYVRK